METSLRNRKTGSALLICLGGWAVTQEPQKSGADEA